jgi:hypothetical protein
MLKPAYVQVGGFLLVMEGREAYGDGAKITACPYDAGSVVEEYWRVGWLEASKASVAAAVPKAATPQDE